MTVTEVMYLTDEEVANINWDAVFKTPESVQQLILDYKGLPDWLIQIHHGVLDRQAPHLRPRIRASVGNGWIKKSNFQVQGIRKRKSRSDIHPNRFRDVMAPLNLVQHQRHHIHLLSRVLNIRTNASPFTLILDDLNQRAMPFIVEMVRRAISHNVNVIVVSFAGIQYPQIVHSIPAHAKSSGEQIIHDVEELMKKAKDSLVIVDSLYDLLNLEGVDMKALFKLVAGKYVSALVGVYHQDMLPAPDLENAYAPQPLDLIKYMATSVITCKSFAHALAAKAAKERSLPEPTFGLLQGAEGIVQCLDANDHTGIVLEGEFRRKSGRPESEVYFLRPARVSDYNMPTSGMIYGTLKQEFVTLLSQVPGYSSEEVMMLVHGAGDQIESTFNLGLTDKQKQAREDVVLPYFDAQKGEGGEGGRILYDMGSEDDFDEEEDEI